MLDPKIEAVLAGMLAAPGPPAHEMTVEEMRANHAQETLELCGDGPDVEAVRDIVVPSAAGGVLVRVVRPHADGPLPIVVWLHGGGWVMGTAGTHEPVARVLANETPALVLAVDYRLAPEHRFPAALEDSLAAVRWAAAHGGELGGDPSRLAIGGDSAGGNLAAVVARRLRGEVGLRLQALVYPVCDAAVSTPSYGQFADRYGLTAASMRRFWELYLDGSNGLDPDASPLRAHDLDGVAPAFVLTADHDVLRDEGEAYAHALERVGVPVTLRRWPGTIHGFVRWLTATDVAGEALGELSGALRRALA